MLFFILFHVSLHVEPSTDRLYHGFGETLYIIGIVLFYAKCDVESRQIEDRKQLI